MVIYYSFPETFFSFGKYLSLLQESRSVILNHFHSVLYLLGQGLKHSPEQCCRQVQLLFGSQILVSLPAT